MRGTVRLASIDHLSIGDHPHLVLLTRRRECLLVPGYTPGKFMISEKIEALKKLGHREEDVAVTLDNAKHAQNVAPGFTPHLCCYFVYQSYFMDRRTVERAAYLFTMDAVGVKIVGEAVLRCLANVRPSLLGPEAAEALRSLIG